MGPRPPRATRTHSRFPYTAPLPTAEPYWLAQRESAHVPPRLAEMLALWRDQPPSAWDFPRVDEIFSAESHQYILYGMGFPVPADLPPCEREIGSAHV